MSARLGGMGGLSQNSGTADADKMLTLMTLGSGGAGKAGLRAEIKEKMRPIIIKLI